MSLRIGIYPGTFDPPTNGHLDIITRAARLVDRLVIGVAINPGKGPMFSLEERAAMVRAEIGPIAERNGTHIEVKPFSSLLLHFARAEGANLIIRGLRALSDFDYEFQMTGMNARLDPEVETVFLMASEKHQFIASRLIKEIALLDGDVSPFMPPSVHERLLARIKATSKGSS
ncbi:MAG: pantetheine-phosphate adenylyltransferase [Acetobacteraceae bacterium]|nr:pantetheine-phosphate adenylyltransferase [Acetobacteraceae bacterium]